MIPWLREWFVMSCQPLHLEVDLNVRLPYWRTNYVGDDFKYKNGR